MTTANLPAVTRDALNDLAKKFVIADEQLQEITSHLVDGMRSGLVEHARQLAMMYAAFINYCLLLSY